MDARPTTIADGVSVFPVRTPTLAPATHTNSYALGERELILVEPSTPYEDERRAWVAWAEALLAQGRTIRSIFLTHHHVDHASGSGFLARALRLPLIAHRATFERIKNVDGVALVEAHDGETFELDGPTPQRWRVLHTPGHAPGHLCLFEERTRALVAGDMVAEGSTILIPPDDGGDMARYLDELRRLDALGPSVLLPAHGGPLRDPHATLTHYVAHRLAREAKIYDAHESLRTSLGRPPALMELVALAYADTPPHLWSIAAMSAEAHLRKLRDEGRV
jgi:ribonuclease/clavin/mitogillin